MMRSILGGKQSAAKVAARPPAAVEISAEGIVAASLPGKGEAPSVAFEPLPTGTIAPGIGNQNLPQPEAVAAAIRKALDRVAPRKRDVTLIIPDTAVRVFVLDFDSLPSKPADVLSVLRFRLRKMVPFDVEHAGISYQVLAGSENEKRVLTAILPANILAEYEAVVGSAGYEPGAVMPSSLAGMAALGSEGPVLAAFLQSTSMTTVIAHGQNVLLYRTLELPEEPATQLTEVQRDVGVAVVYFEDRLATRPRRLHFAGRARAQQFSAMIKEFGLEVVELAEPLKTGPATVPGTASLAGVMGALAEGI
jgi:type IV pilus assembly protein PilM